MQCMRTEGKKMASAQPTGNKLFSLILLSKFFSFCFVNILLSIPLKAFQG